MASAELTVAKAALSGALFRADPRACSRDEIESMIALLNTAIAECSPPNVQKFKQWALSNLVPSSARIAPFCKYLVALAGALRADFPPPTQSQRGRLSSVRRRRLHILYILNDILYHVKFRTRDQTFADKLSPALPSLIRSASSFSNSPKQLRKIRDLVALWEEQEYFAADFLEKLRGVIGEAPVTDASAQGDSNAANAASSITKAAKAAPFVMPAMHGDPSIPWYDLPAGNWLSVLEPNSTRPMNPEMIKPLVLQAGPADRALTEAVKRLLADVDKIYSKEAGLEKSLPDIGQMGEFLDVDELDGEVRGGETYYGWSRAFCKKMRARKRGEDVSDKDQNRGRSRSTRSYSRSPSPSRSPSRSPARAAFKRPRLSTSPRGGRNRSRDRSWSRSASARNTSRRRDRDYRGSRTGSRVRSRSRSRSRSDAGSQTFRPKSPSYSESSQSPLPYSPPPPPPAGLPPRPQNNNFGPPNLQMGNYHHPPPMPYSVPPPPIPPPTNFGQFPVPYPPPPPQYQGPWPPPPPPHMGHPPQNFYPGANVPPPFVGGWGAPVPPPPPPLEHLNAFQQNRGGDGHYRGQHGGSGGGGYGRGGARW